MINFNAHYAHGLLEYAEALDMLQGIFSAANCILGDDAVERTPETDAIVRFMKLVPRRSRKAVLRRFAALAHERLRIMDVELFTPYPPTERQTLFLSAWLEQTFNKYPIITAKQDETLLGGVRIIADNKLMDDSIRQKISGLKQALYEAVIQ